MICPCRRLPLWGQDAVHGQVGHIFPQPLAENLLYLVNGHVSREASYLLLNTLFKLLMELGFGRNASKLSRGKFHIFIPKFGDFRFWSVSRGDGKVSIFIGVVF